MSDNILQNAVIQSTRLGVQHTDHGILSFYIYLDYGGAIQSFGGLVLDDVNPEIMKDRFADIKPVRVATLLASSLLLGINEVFKKDWEQLPGTSCRAYGDFNHVDSIGHYLKDIWLWYDGELFVTTKFDEMKLGVKKE